MEKQAKEINFSSLRPPLFHKTVNVVWQQYWTKEKNTNQARTSPVLSQ